MEVTAEDVDRWSKQCLLDGEIPLARLIDHLKKSPRSYTVARSPKYKTRLTVSGPSLGLGLLNAPRFQLCSKSGEAALVSHAVVVKYATPVDTGNFVPPGNSLPDGVFSDSW